MLRFSQHDTSALPKSRSPFMTWAYKSIALATPSTASHPPQPAHSSANNPPAASSETQGHL
ncbi:MULTISPECIES: hypothetical protein [unclassified Microcoleus]|uniref:hypothetical protein n=1 Tax=unclassified Microcoleus TaxID=2642155 RepID=UPI002FD0FD3D